jgi:hypothetical protein
MSTTHPAPSHSSASKRVALVSCQDLPEWEVDDHPLFEALKRRHIDLAHPAWDDPDFDWASCDLVIPRTTWDYQERAEEFKAWLTRVDQHSTLLNPLSILIWNLNKGYLRALDVATPETVWLDRVAESDALPDVRGVCAKRGWTMGFLKPVVGACAWGTLRFDLSDADVGRALDAHLDEWLRRGEMILQPYHQSVETEGEFSLLFFDHEFSHGVQKIPVPGDYRVQDDFGASDRPWIPPADWLEVGYRLMESLPERTLYARCDFLRGAQGEPLLIELELIEPSLFFRHDPQSPERMADAICRRLTPS